MDLMDFNKELTKSAPKQKKWDDLTIENQNTLIDHFGYQLILKYLDLSDEKRSELFVFLIRENGKKWLSFSSKGQWLEMEAKVERQKAIITGCEEKILKGGKGHTAVMVAMNNANTDIRKAEGALSKLRLELLGSVGSQLFDKEIEKLNIIRGGSLRKEPQPDEKVGQVVQEPESIIKSKIKTDSESLKKNLLDFRKTYSNR